MFKYFILRTQQQLFCYFCGIVLAMVLMLLFPSVFLFLSSSSSFCPSSDWLSHPVDVTGIKDKTCPEQHNRR
jgi:multidrug efflux pump subunit AcrB